MAILKKWNWCNDTIVSTLLPVHLPRPEIKQIHTCSRRFAYPISKVKKYKKLSQLYRAIQLRKLLWTGRGLRSAKTKLCVPAPKKIRCHKKVQLSFVEEPLITFSSSLPLLLSRLIKLLINPNRTSEVVV